MENPKRWKPSLSHVFVLSTKAWVLCLTWILFLKQTGDTWTSGCNTCICDNDSMSIQCQPVLCPTTPSPNCSLPGQQLVNHTDGCCTTQSCGGLKWHRTRWDSVRLLHLCYLYATKWDLPLKGWTHRPSFYGICFEQVIVCSIATWNYCDTDTAVPMLVV